MIKRTDIHKDVRTLGGILKKIMPKFTEDSFYLLSKKVDKFVKGRWFGKNTVVEARQIARSNGTRLRILICRSKKGTRSNATGLLWIHGGGYAMGAPEQDFLFADLLTADGNCVAVMPDYTLSTKAPYPAALEDCYLALLWLKAHTEELDINPKQLFVGGDSAGGGLTAAVCLYARDNKDVTVSFQMPLYPMLDDRMMTASVQNNDAPVWNTPSNIAGWKLYLKGFAEDTIPVYAAPARALDLSNLPPACTYVGTIDPFYDETKEYVKRLREHGVDVKFKEYEGCFHAFDVIGASTKVGKNARKFLLENFRLAQKKY